LQIKLRDSVEERMREEEEDLMRLTGGHSDGCHNKILSGYSMSGGMRGTAHTPEHTEYNHVFVHEPQQQRFL